MRLKCSFCHQSVEGNYYKYETGEIVCDRCFKSSPRCSLCNMVMKKWRKFGKRRICKNCTKSLTYCTSCKQPIFEKYFTINSREDELYCERCISSKDRCDACQRPTDRNAVKYPDGRIICKDCDRTAIKDGEKALSILVDVAKFLRTELGLYIPEHFNMILTNANKIASVSGGKFEPTKKFDGRSCGVFVKKGNKTDVYIEYGLPRLIFKRVLAHEYTHAWQSENCPLQQSTKLKEGFAEWAVYKLLIKQKAREELLKMVSRKDLYGAGLRKFLDLEKEKGQDYVIEFVKKHL